MNRVSLRFETHSRRFPDFGRSLNLIRLVGEIEFLLPDGTFSPPQTGVIDTGAPWCILPRYIWQPIDMDVRCANTHFGGVSRRKVSQIRAAAAIVRGRIVDGTGGATQTHAFPAYLAKSDRVPLILGFADLFEHFGAYLNHNSGQAWIEEP